MKPRKLHTLHRPAKQANGHPPLLFVHGGYIHADCWDMNFLPYFSASGYDCHAINLSGHGASEGIEDLDSYGIDDYAGDLRQLAAQLATPPVLIGHSMGALVVQRYLEKGTAAAAILMAPVPTTGTIGCGVRQACRHPDFMVEAMRAVEGKYTRHTARLMREVYFSPDVSAEEFAAFKPLVHPESLTAVLEMMALPWRLPLRHAKIPALVMGGEFDALFPANQLHFVACGWQADISVIPRAGHMLMMEPQWPTAAAQIDHWIGRKLS